jgi:hypothetical protein
VEVNGSHNATKGRSDDDTGIINEHAPEALAAFDDVAIKNVR